jgi:ribosomal 30S subunit maturation factor RimM
MADSLKFSKGLQQYLPSTLEDNTFYVTTDTHKIYLQGGVWEDTSSINETIGEIEEVVAESLTDLDARLKAIEDKTSDSETEEEEPNVSSSTIKVTYEELKQLRYNGELIPSVKYRITDYVTTTAQGNTVSANHPFDIIVEALSEDTLSEDAKAIQNENDGYFDDCNLNAWEIKYCFDNDSNRFAWANNLLYNVNSSLVNIDETLVDGFTFKEPFSYDYSIIVDSNSNTYDIEGGELFYEYGRETNPDELENQLCIYKSNAELWEEEGADYDDKFFYYGTEIVDGIEYDKWRKACFENDKLIWVDNAETINGYGNKFFLTKKITKNSDLLTKEQANSGIIYYMKDEHGNECPYDFKNIKFLYDDNDDTNEDRYFYTFSLINNDNEIEDLTLNQHLTSDDGFCYGTHHNIIKPYYGENEILKLTLNSNIFILTNDKLNEYYGCFCNTFNYGCHSNIIYCNECSHNTFGNGCFNNTFGNGCFNNTFGNYCYNNTFGGECYNNTFGNDCNDNTFNGSCYDNTFGNTCYNNTFGNDCKYNTFGNGCFNNTFNGECYNNTFNIECYNNTFDVSCHYNTLGNKCFNNTFGNDCYNNTFGNECTYNTFGYECAYNTLSNNCHYNTFGNECAYNTFGNECAYNTFGDYYYYNTFGNVCFNISFYDGSSTYFNDELYIYQSDGVLLNNVINNRFGDSCQNLLIHIGDVDTYNEESNIQNLIISQGLSSTKKDDNDYFELELIPITVFNQDYEIKVARNSKGELKIYCEADLIG